MSRGSAVGIATGHGLHNKGTGVRNPVGTRISSISFREILRPTQPPLQWVPEALSPVVKRQKHEADHSILTCAEVMETYISIATPPNVFTA
jgi:hypothetical protein